MAESLISGVLQKIKTLGGDLLNTISSNLIEKISAISKVESSIEHIQNEFILIQVVISKANKCLSNDSMYLAWLERVRGIALQIEDTIDEYAYLLGQAACKDSYFKKFTGSFKNLKEWDNIATRIKQLEAELEKIKSAHEFYGFSLANNEANSSSNSIMNQQIMNYSYFIDEDEIVGNVEEFKALTKWLTNGRKERTVISICGMGGVGKTTIAHSLYKKQEAAGNFQCYAWVSVSANYVIEDLLKRIIKQILSQKGRRVSPGIDSMNLRELVNELKSKLWDKKYLIILDDVWQTNAILLCHAFPKNDQGSRVIITTRKEDVATLADGNNRIKLNKLSEEESWDLFCKKAFCTLPENKCPENLISWGKKIVTKCQGLPLAIVVVGSLLACRDRNEQEWKWFHNQLGWELSNNPQIKDVLNLSIKDLPQHIRNCFLYCGLFPEDADISGKQISRLWIAEGFVQEMDNNITLEEVAERYLKELVYRSLILAEKNVYGKIKRFRMHDLLRDLCIDTAKKERFYVVWDKPHQTIRFSEEARRISVQKGSEDIQHSSGSNKLCSFLLFDIDMSSSCIQNALKSLRLLRVLSLSNSKIQEVPEIIFELFNLHYLDLSWTKVSKISKSLGNLHNLQTLNLARTGVEKLPCEISKLKKLRHLFVMHILDYRWRAFDRRTGVSLPTNISALKDLQSLQMIEATRELVENLRKLKLLRTLHLCKVQQSIIAELRASMALLPDLISLAIQAINSDEVLNLNFLDPLPDLEKLYFHGRMEMRILPKVFGSLHKLRQIHLCWCGLKEDPLGSLAHMSNLVSLHLIRAYDGEMLTFRQGYFPNLSNLVLIDLAQLIQIEIEGGAMTNLKWIQLTGLQSLECVPEGFSFLRTLQRIVLEDMPEVFVEKLKGEESRLIQHVPHIAYRD